MIYLHVHTFWNGKLAVVTLHFYALNEKVLVCKFSNILHYIFNKLNIQPYSIGFRLLAKSYQNIPQLQFGQANPGLAGWAAGYQSELGTHSSMHQVS